MLLLSAGKINKWKLQSILSFRILMEINKQVSMFFCRWSIIWTRPNEEGRKKKWQYENNQACWSFLNYLIALVRPDSFVDHSNVFDEIRLFVEAVLAVVAHERSLVQVDGAEVPVQIALGFVLEKT